ncbi:MAG: glycosyltransferase [Chloroflexi bacterium]|nr:glycosyltransferase [Chloroflexota bacterium]
MNSPNKILKSNSGKNPKRVALIHDCTAYGGLEAHILMLARYLDPARYTPLVVVPGYTDEYRSSPTRFIEEVQALGLPLLRPVDPGNNRILSYLKDVRNVRNLLKANEVDIVHIHTRRPEGARKATLSARLAGIQAVIRTEHVTPSVSIKPYSKYVIKPFDWLTNYVVTVSESNRQEQLNLLGRNPQKVYCSYGGIEIERFNPIHDVSEAKRRLGLDPALPVAGTVGRLSEEKGHTYIIRAAERVLKEYGPVNFVLVGNGPLETQLKEQIAQLGLEQYFHLVGFQSNPIPYIEAMDITLMSSLNEALGLSLLEFMAMGKPSVVTAIPSFKEILRDGESGLIVPAQDSQAFAEGILKLLHDPVLAAGLAQAALKQVRLKFTIQRMTSDIMNLYDSLLI